jgi:hypothetical protein
MKAIVFSLLLLVGPSASWSDDGCDCTCNHCGCPAHCHKVCHVVCEMKDVKVTCYCCRAEDLCIPGPSQKCGAVCEPNPCCLAHPTDCDSCNSGGCCSSGCGQCKCETRTLWQPTCSGDIRTVHKLIKYEVTKKVPTYKWVVEYCCDQCCCAITDEARHDGKQTAVAARTANSPTATSVQATVQAPAPPPEESSGELSRLRPTDQPEHLQPAELKPDEQQSGVVRTAHTEPSSRLPWSYLFK